MQARLRRPGSAILAVAWALAAALILFAAENIWLDSLLRSRWHRLPSLVPEEGSTGWLVAFGFMGLSSALLLVCQIFLTMDRSAWPFCTLENCNLPRFAASCSTLGGNLPSRLKQEHLGSSPGRATWLWSVSDACEESLREFRTQFAVVRRWHQGANDGAGVTWCSISEAFPERLDTSRS